MKLRNFSLLAMAGLVAACSVQYQAKITKKELSDNIRTLSSDQFQGRKPGLPGDSLAARFIANKFRQAGLQMLYNNGYQYVKLVTGFKFGPENHLASSGRVFKTGEDFEPMFFSANKGFEGRLAIAGYGMTVSTDSLKWDDYAGQELKEQWVLILEGLPAQLQNSREARKYADIRTKVLNAIDHHAGGILVVSPDYNTKGAAKATMFDKNSVPYSVPILKISQAAADAILSGQTTISDLENSIKTSKLPAFRATTLTVKGEASVLPKLTMTQNIVGMIPGTDKNLSNEYIVIGAHYDHLGFGGQGSGSRMPDTVAVHHGADDNASGVAAVIELAKRLSQGHNIRRTLVFAAFTAEEFGLIGSKAFVTEPPFSLKNAVAMINFDMVGRLDSARNLTIGGVGTALESKALIDSLIHGFQVKMSLEGYGPSDHASFYGENIPVIYFNTGVHDQYHTPNDTWNRINISGEKDITENAALLIRAIAGREKKLTYQESGPKTATSGRTDLKVTLGIIPDFAGTGTGGMRIDGVTPGKPASKAGLQKGDIIVAIDGKKVGSIYDYMARMKAYSPGDNISVDIMRNGAKMVFLVTL